MAALNSKNILLIHPLGYSVGSEDRDISRIANIMPPLGLASMAAYLKNQNIVSFIVDCYAHPNSDRLIQEYLQAEKPAFIGLSCTTSSFLDGCRIARLAKIVLPDIFSVFGGPHVSALKQKILINFPEVDFVVVGEGEPSLTELIQNVGTEPDTVQGVVYRTRDGEIKFNGYRRTAVDLDNLPFPAYEMLDGFPEVYSLPIFNYPKAPNTSCISSRGCPYRCSYCDRSVFQRTYRYNSAAYLYEHLHHLKDHFGIRHINFYDDQFTFNRKRVEDFTRLLIAGSLGMTFNCAVRAEHIDLDLLQQMKAAGCWMISLGIETGDEDLLARHRQNPDLTMMAEKIRMIKKVGIRTKGLLMMGLPGETEGSIKKSLDYVFSLPLDDFNMSKFTPFPGSPLYENIHEFGSFTEDWAKMDCMHFLFIPKGLTRKRLDALFKKFYKTRFLTGKVIWNYITMLWKSPHSWIRFVKNLKEFIRFARSNARKPHVLKGG